MRFPRWRRRTTALALAYACLGVVSCDNPLAPDEATVARIDVTPPLLQMEVGSTRSLAARVLAEDGSILDDRRTYWSSQNPTVATVSQAGIVTGVAPGSIQVAVSAGGKSTVVPVTVTPRPVTQVRVTPTTASVQVGSTVSLSAQPLDATGGAVAGRPVIWASSASAIATVSSTGIVTGVAAGSANITATADGVTGTAVVTVTPIPVATVTISPTGGSVTVGQSLQLSATTASATGQTLPGRVVTWQSNASGVATVSSTGLVLGIAPGTATITATSEGRSSNVTVTVSAVPVASIRVTPTTASVAAGQTVQLTAQALDANDNPLSRTITWSSEQPSIATVSPAGLVTAVSAGATRILASVGSVSAAVALTVTQVPVASISLAPTSGSLVVGGTLQLTATPRDATGTALTGRVITWITGAPTVASVNQSGLVTGIAPGSAVIFAASEGESASATVTVSNVTVSTVSITPAGGNVQQGQNVQLTATPRDPGGNVIPGRPVTWSSSDETIATVSSTGRLVAITPGTVTITATVDGVQGNVQFTVTPVPVGSVQVTPGTATLAINQLLQLTVSLFDASSNPLSTAGRVISWSTSNAGVASVSATGVVTAVASGSANITVLCEGFSATAAITVSLVPVATVTLTPSSISLNQGSTQGITATAFDALGNPLTGRPVAWSSLQPAIATVNTATTGTGNTITAVAPGSATVSAVIGGVTGLATVTVTQVPIATITVTPSPATVTEGSTVTLTATARDASSNVLTGRTIVWSSSNPSVSVSQAGVVTAVLGAASQAATITASSPGGGAGGSTPSGSASVSVLFAPVGSVVSAPATANVSIGNTTPLTASLFASGGQPLSATGRTVTWTSLTPGVATVSAAGVVSGVSIGTAQIVATASSPGQAAPFPADTSVVTVNNVPVASVVVVPNPGTVHVGTTYQRTFTATALDASNNPLTGRTFVWTSSNQAVATVDANTGVVTGVATGNATITATSEGVNGTSAVTVDLVSVSSVTVSPSSATLNPAVPASATQALTATPLDSAGNTISGAALGSRTTSWSTSNGTVATVNTSGLVTAVAQGSATITATVAGPGGNTGTSSITVVAPVTALTVGVAPDSLILPGTLTGPITVLNGATALAGRVVTLTSSNSAVATVSPASATTNGSGQVSATVTGVAAGSVTITATSEGVSQPLSLRMLNPVASVSVAASPDSVIGTGGAPVNATATLRDAANAVLTGRPTTWSSSNTAVATVSSSGVITAVGTGSSTITATAEGVNGTLTFRVLAPVNTVNVTSPGDSVLGTGTLQATATLLDAGLATITGRPVTWSSSNTALATVSTTGLITGVAPGTVTITATSEGKSGNATIRILAGVTAIALTPATDSLIGTATLALTATATGAGATPIQGRILTITSGTTAAATVSPASGTTNASGQVPLTISGVAPGTSLLTVSHSGVTATRTIRVLAPVASVSLTSPGDSVIGTATLQVTPTLRDAALNVLTGRPTTWASSNTAVATVSATGLVTGVAAGTANITATSEGQTSTALTVRVLAPVATVSLAAAADSVIGTGSVQVTPTLRDAATNVLTGRPIAWSTSNAALATVSSSGLVTGVAAGNVTITATSEGQSSNVVIRVLAPIAAIALTPATDSLIGPAGTTLGLTATATASGGGALQGRPLALSSSSTGVATVAPSTGTTNASGQVALTVTFVTAGTTTLTVSGEGQNGTRVLRMLAPVSSVVASTPGDSVIGTGTLQAAVTLRDASNNVLTGRPVTWASSNTAAATISASGLITGVAAGTTNITATSEGVVSAAVAIRVLAPVNTVSITAPDSSVFAGQTQQATAVARDASNNILTGRPVTWASSNTAKATISSSGLITAVDSGSTTISATVEGKVASFVFTVSLVPAATVTVSPSTLSDSTGKTRTFTAQAFDGGGAPLTGRAFTWSSSNTARLSINATSGLATLIDSGSVTVTATTSPGTGGGGTASGTASVTIVHSPVNLVVVPGTESVGIGASKNITANVTDLFGGNAASRSCTVTSSDPTKVTVSPASGTTSTIGTLQVTLTGVASGTSNVTVTCETKSGTTVVTVP